MFADVIFKSKIMGNNTRLCFSVHDAELKGVSLWWKLIGELH